jgi:hypothetical protein
VGLVILAVVLAVIATGGVALVPLIATLLKASTALGLLGLAGRTGLWATDNGSGKDVLWELAGVLTLGTGKAVSAGARGLSGRRRASPRGGPVSRPPRPSWPRCPMVGGGRRGFALGEESIARHVSEVHRIGPGQRRWAGDVGVRGLGRRHGGHRRDRTRDPARRQDGEGCPGEYLSDQGAADRANRTRIVQQWSMPLLHARAR